MLIRCAALAWVGLCVEVAAGTLPLLHVGAANLPTPNASTPIFSSVQLSASGALDIFGATQCPQAIVANCITTTNSISKRVPMPFPGVINSATVVAVLGTAPTAQVTMRSNINNVDGNVTCTFAIGVQNGVCTGFDSVPANAAFQWHFSSTAWNQAAPSQISFLYTAISGQHVAILLQPGNFGVGVGGGDYGFPGSISSGTAVNQYNIFCQACAGTINGLAVLPNATENGANAHSYQVFVNGVNVMSCSGTLSSPAVCSATGSVAINAGDEILIFGTCATSCATTFPGVGLDFTPNTLNVVPVFANQVSQSAGFMGVSDFTQAAGQTTYQVVPANMTFSSYQVCGVAATTGTQTRTAILQGGPAGAAPPTTKLTATITSATGACPGSNAATYLSGATVAGTYSAPAGSTIDHSYTVANSPTTTPIKISAAVTVP